MSVWNNVKNTDLPFVRYVKFAVRFIYIYIFIHLCIKRIIALRFFFSSFFFKICRMSNDFSVSLEYLRNVYKIISFLKFLVNSLCGRTIEFKRIFPEARLTLVPAFGKRNIYSSRWCQMWEILKLMKQHNYDWNYGSCSWKILRLIGIFWETRIWGLCLPRIVMEGFNLPFTLKSGGFSILANGLFGFGSQGVPSTRAHSPTTLLRPTMLWRTTEWAWMWASARTIDSRILTPASILA